MILLVQDATQRFDTWSYAGFLVIPAATGVGLVLWGRRSDRPGLTAVGTRSALVGLALFSVGALIVESTCRAGSWSALSPGRWGCP